MDILVLDLDIENNDREKLLSHLAGKLYDMNYVDEKYLEALLKREREYSTGLVVKSGFNVAIPHADVEYVKREALVVVKTHRKVTFRKMDEPDIEIPVVFLLVIKEPKGYVKFLASLTELFSKEEFIKTILNGASREIEEYLKRHLLSTRLE
jgi:PTS system galactitol-specific IIA component